MRWTGPARQNLREIRRYIAQDSPRAAQAVSNDIMQAVRRLETFPESGRLVPEHADSTMRELIVRPYRVQYRYLAERNEVQIITVFHGSRQFPPLPG